MEPMTEPLRYKIPDHKWKKNPRRIVIQQCVHCRERYQVLRPWRKSTFCSHKCQKQWCSVNLTVYEFCPVCQGQLSSRKRNNRKYFKRKTAYCSDACYRYRIAQQKHMRNVVRAEWDAIRKATTERLARELKAWYDNGGCFWKMKNYFLKLPPEFWKVAPEELKFLIRAASSIRRLPTAAKRQQRRREVREAALAILEESEHGEEATPAEIPEQRTVDSGDHTSETLQGETGKEAHQPSARLSVLPVTGDHG